MWRKSNEFLLRLLTTDGRSYCRGPVSEGSGAPKLTPGDGGKLDHSVNGYSFNSGTHGLDALFALTVLLRRLKIKPGEH